LQTSSNGSTVLDRSAAEAALREAATELFGTAPMRSRIGEVFSAGFGRDDWESARGPWNPSAAAAAVARCYARPGDPSKSMAVAIRIETLLGSRPVPSEASTRIVVDLAAGWMDVLSSRIGDVAALTRDPAFAEIGRALADEAFLAPDLLADGTVETARSSIAAVGSPAQVAAVTDALPELRRIVGELFRRPRHPGWPAFAAVLLSLQAFKVDAARLGEEPLVAFRDKLLDAGSDVGALTAAASMLGGLGHRPRAALVSGMLDDVARCILQATVLSGRGLDAFGRDLLAETDLPASPFARVPSSPDLFWPLPPEDAIGAAGEPEWRGLTDPDRPAAPVVEWHRITTEEDAAADMLFRCGRRDLSNGVSLQAGDLASDTAHVVARGTDPRLLVPVGIVLVRRRLVAGRGRFVYEVEMTAVGMGAGETPYGVENMLLRSVEEATLHDLPLLVEAHSGSHLDIRCTVSPSLAATSERLARIFPGLSANDIDLPRHAVRQIDEFVAARRAAVVAAARSDAPPRPSLAVQPAPAIARAKPLPFLAPPRRGGRTRFVGR
jgi:hypothetical protein